MSKISENDDHKHRSQVSRLDDGADFDRFSAIAVELSVRRDILSDSCDGFMVRFPPEVIFRSQVLI
jgi:hypothetical protein